MDHFRGILPGVSFLFHSDDIPYCTEHFGHFWDCHFHEGKSEEDDLVSLSCCEHQICSASTFAWWGAWLNQNPDKQVIMPKRWFSEAEEKKCNTQDIVPYEWTRA